jgi:hypothetical protein
VNGGNSTWPMTTSVSYARPSSPDPEFLAALTRRSRLELGAYATSARTARGHIARVPEDWDPVTTAPVPRAAGEADESGRGLAVVAELSAACGFYYAADPGGKVTWAVIGTP